MSIPLPSQVPTVSADQVSHVAAPLAGPLNPQTWTQQPLYGGAITVAIPNRFIDCSQFRHIPDHQVGYIYWHAILLFAFFPMCTL
jgi:hypothetical protein